MMKKLFGLFAITAMVVCLCACSTEKEKDYSVSFPSVYMNTMEQDFDVYYVAGKDFEKTPKTVTLANETETKDVDIYNCEEELNEGQRIGTIECGIGFDTETGTPEEDVRYTRCTIVWNDGSEDSFDCDITFAADKDCDDWISYSEEASATKYRAVFNSPASGEYKLTEESAAVLGEVAGNYSLLTEGEKTVLEMGHPAYDVVTMDLLLVCESKAYVLEINCNMYR